MQKKLNLREFYPDETGDKNMRTLRTGLLAGIVVWLSDKEMENDLLKVLKKLLNVTYVSKFQSVHVLMNHLKGSGSVDTRSYAYPVGEKMIKILDLLPLDKWVSTDNIEQSLKYNFIDLKLVRAYVASDKLYYEWKEEDDVYKEKEFITSNIYEQAITVPLLKGTLFFFAALGILDVAYDRPDVSVMGQTAHSYFDGLRYVRLTKLGAYLLERTKTYDTPQEIVETKMKLSEDSLTIISKKDDPTAAVILDPYTLKVTPNRFRTDFSIFLKGITNQRELQSKIEMFKQSVTKDLPENWIVFFKELERKIDPIKKVSNVSIFKIPEDDQVLINLIAKDEVFQKIVMKAEGFQILVGKKDLAKFKGRMREYGYLLSK